MKDGISKYMNMPDITEEEAKKYGAQVGEDGKSLSWWTDEEEREAAREAAAKGEASFGTLSPVTSEMYEKQSPEVMNPTKLPEEKSQSDSGGASMAVSHGGGLLKNEDFTEYRKKRAEQIARQKAAVAAGERAAKAEEERLLATGMYFSDGRGNIKLKKEYRKQSGGRAGRGNYDKGTEHNTYADATSFAIEDARRKAAQSAYSAYGDDGFEAALARQKEEARQSRRTKTQEMIEMNGFERSQLDEAKKQRATNIAESHVAIYRGLVTALKALDSDNKAEQAWRERTEGGLLKDKDGRLIGAGSLPTKYVVAKNTGYRQNPETKTRSGIVGINVIDSINKSLEEGGNKYFRLTGIIAQQGVDAIGNKNAPTFYVQGVRANGEKFGKTMTMEEVYNFGKENLVESGVDADEAEGDVIDEIGDVFGVRRRKEAALMRDPKYRESVAKAKLAEWKADNPEKGSSSMSPERLALEGAKLEQRKAEEEGRNARYGASGDVAKIRAALTASKDLNSLIWGLGLKGEAAEKFKASLADIITGGFSKEENGGKAEVKKGDNTGNAVTPTNKPTREEAIKKLLASGRYKLDENGKVVPK